MEGSTEKAAKPAISVARHEGTSVPPRRAEQARWAYEERNKIRRETRDQMRQSGLAAKADELDRTDPEKPWEFYYHKYGGDYDKIIDGAGRPRPIEFGG